MVFNTHLKRVFKGKIHSYLMYNLPKEKILEIHSFAKNKKEKEKLGQRKISKLIKEKFKVEISENTIAGWIYFNNIPYANEKTQFKQIPIPKKEKIYKMYIIERQSAQKMAGRYNVSTITAINWLKGYGIPVRTHKESMNTLLIKKDLKNKKLKRPIKEFSKLSPEKAYIIGVLCGDAHINNTCIRFEIRNDEEFIKSFIRCIKEVYGLDYSYHYYSKRNSFVSYISNQIICHDLLKHGKFKTFEWRVPKEIIDNKDEKIISNFLRGMFDSEGTSSKYCVSMSSANEMGINEVSTLLWIIGIGNKVMKTKSGYYVLYITKKERLKKFKDKIGFTIKRKMESIAYLK